MMSYFVREQTAFFNKRSKGDILKMLIFLIDIFVEFDGRVFQQTFSILKGTTTSRLVLYSSEAESIIWLLRNNWKEMTRSIHLNFCYIGYGLSVNISTKYLPVK